MNTRSVINTQLIQKVKMNTGKKLRRKTVDMLLCVGNNAFISVC